MSDFYCRKTVTIQKTSKHWKGLKILAWILALFLIPMALMSGSENLFNAAVCCSVGLYYYAKVMAWWHHG